MITVNLWYKHRMWEHEKFCVGTLKTLYLGFIDEYIKDIAIDR